MYQRFGKVLRSSPNQSASDTARKLIFLTEKKRLADNCFVSYIMLNMRVEMNQSF